jgi:hypothetical protein
LGIPFHPAIAVIDHVSSHVTIMDYKLHPHVHVNPFFPSFPAGNHVEPKKSRLVIHQGMIT